jgi:hypothetical protein
MDREYGNDISVSIQCGELDSANINFARGSSSILLID